MVNFRSTTPTNRKPPNISYTREHSGAYVEHETRFELIESTAFATASPSNMLAHVRQLLRSVSSSLTDRPHVGKEMLALISLRNLA